MLFSQRQGLKPIKNIIQIDRIDKELRTCLWNALTKYYWNKADFTFRYVDNSDILDLIKCIWHQYFKKPIDSISDWDTVYSTIRNYYFECKWYEVYDFIEFISEKYIPVIKTSPDDLYTNQFFMEECNLILESECSGYRFIDGIIAPITSEIEIKSIEDATSHESKYNSTSIHLKSALSMLSDKNNPDYRNSIKESISAVEALCYIILGKKATLGDALRKIEKDGTIQVHPSLKDSFIKLYGYTNDADGIRHGLLDESDLKFEDALFMLVSCSAFVNYLIAKHENQ